MDQCNLKEAETHVLVHLPHALQFLSLEIVYTGDTDVVEILLSNFHHVKTLNPAEKNLDLLQNGKDIQNDLFEHYRYKPGLDNEQSHGSFPRIDWIR